MILGSELYVWVVYRVSDDNVTIDSVWDDVIKALKRFNELSSDTFGEVGDAFLDIKMLNMTPEEMDNKVETELIKEE